ncbi:type I DNA topoisomerase [Roseisolibacter agri]|uniref:DNA topoisomerase 1 n=1 Tax=Roseisolibacter agri TaxID=2014610 RepID=A0AA37Q7J4_9BACT|nr:type I DNA topoisomerase [Roseisolibacter agri]GLC25187.1 DNA topoisomerase I [Roseisolibacter agri]
MPRTLVIVESPNKAKKLTAFLGPGYTVKASFGHVADLPPKDYGVNLDTLEEQYVLRGKGAEIVKTLRAAVQGGGYDQVLLASDPDREGEAIAWHLARQLKLPARAASRIEFREITAAAVRAAVASPRPVDMRRVDAQRSRRVLDRIVGFDCSKEICWPAGAQSAGRCQTPALHLLCEREREILAFAARTYWTLETTYAEGLSAFVPADPKEQASQPDTDGREPDDPSRRSGEGRLAPKQYASREEAEAVLATARAHAHRVRGVEPRRTERRPPPPYTTSTLQQDASRKLRLSAKQAMDAAQALFEAGLITYHRTDSTRVSDDAVDMARAFMAAHHSETLPAQAPRARAPKAGAQDAHEAIRPTHLEGEDAPPPQAAKLYAMIRARFLASQAKPAVFDRTTVWIDSGPIAWVAEGAVLREPGFLVFWGPYSRQEDVVLPALAPGQVLSPTDLLVHEKQTTPPSRYDQGALIKKLETSGIGRPATFAGIIETLLKRDYVRELAGGKGKKFLQPTEFGLQVDGLMSHTFPDLVTERYTAEMEAQLDAIEGGAATRPAYLRAWYDAFRAAMARAHQLGAEYRQAHGLRARRPGGGGGAAEETTVRCDRCGEATYRKIARKKGKGSFLACPACRMTRDVRAKVRPGACPTCHSALIEKKIGKMTPFWGCVRYGAAERPCTYAERGPAPTATATPDAAAVPARATKSAVKRAAKTSTTQRAGAKRAVAAPPPAAERVPAASSRPTARDATDRPCPRCSSATLDVVTPSGEAPFWACTDRACGFTLLVGARRRAQPCPHCGGVVLERRSADGASSFWECARHPACDYTAARG